MWRRHWRRWPWLLATTLVAALAAVSAADAPVAWRSDFTAGLRDWPGQGRGWGEDNREFLTEASPAGGRVMRVHIRKGSFDPASMVRRGEPRSGSGFKSPTFAAGTERARLAYWVRFPADFDFVRGGKLPGLYGGRGNSGGLIPDGSDGFSTRLMWRARGLGEVYAYLPSSQVHGSSLLQGRLAFVPGRWHHVVQELLLNRPDHADGQLRLWLDGELVGELPGLEIRRVSTLRIDGIFFDVFFGGGDASWAASADTHVDFAGFSAESLPGPAVR